MARDEATRRAGDLSPQLQGGLTDDRCETRSAATERVKQLCCETGERSLVSENADRRRGFVIYGVRPPPSSPFAGSDYVGVLLLINRLSILPGAGPSR